MMDDIIDEMDDEDDGAGGDDAHVTPGGPMSTDANSSYGENNRFHEVCLNTNLLFLQNRHTTFLSLELFLLNFVCNLDNWRTNRC